MTTVLRRIGWGFIALLLAVGWVAPASAGVFDSAWNRKMVITFSGYNPPGGGTLTDFPALVVFSNNLNNSGFTYTDVAFTNAADLRFTTADGLTELNYEIDTWNPNGTSFVWVRTPSIASSSDYIWAYWGNGAATQPDYTTNGATWDPGYRAVYHLGDAANNAQAVDSTTNGRTALNGTSANATGMIADGQVFANAAASALTNTAGLGDLSVTGVTVSAWVNLRNNRNYPMVLTYSNTPNAMDFRFNAQTKQVELICGSSVLLTANSGDAIPENQWHHIAATLDDPADTVRLYVDGRMVKQSTSCTNHLPASGIAYIGRRSDTYYFDGFMDEVRVSGVARSSNWLWACYVNTSSNMAFNNYGYAQSVTLPTLSCQAASDITPTSATLNGTVVSSGTVPASVFVCWGTSDGGTNAVAWANTAPFVGSAAPGPLATNVNLSLPNAIYYYRYGATNSGGVIWAPASMSFMAGTVNTFTNAGNWNADTNWSLGHIPTEGEGVLINANVTLSNSPASLSSYTLSAGKTHTFTGTNTVLTSTVVVVNGTITHPLNSDTNWTDGWQPDNCLGIVCSNLTVSVGGAINADYKGYRGGHNTWGGAGGVNECGFGPGAASASHTAGGSYGGRGGNGGTSIYGIPGNPAAPGSGGGAYAGDGGLGGGWIWIRAAGAVQVNGTLSANGQTGPCGGSGGAINVACATFSGIGAVSARGGNSSTSFGPGGGGRIAISNDPVQQLALPLPAVLISADRGTGGLGGAEMGTVFLNDCRLLPEMLHAGYNGRYYGITNWAANTLSVTSGWICLSEVSLQLTVTNDLTVGGQLELTNCTMTCLRNLVVTNGGRLYLYSGMTNGSPVTNYGALVSVAQDLIAYSNGWVYPVSHWSNGGSCFFQASNLTVQAGGGINADAKGYRGGTAALNSPWGNQCGWGPGAGPSQNVGAGYGGVGGAGGYGPYGSVTAPAQPGSGGGAYSGDGGWGGGLVWMQVSNSVAVSGTISARGGAGAAGSAGSGGSGGGIFITCRTVTGSNGLVSANGGLGYKGGGGGGRIALVYNTTAQNALPNPSLSLCANYGTGPNGNGGAGTIYLPDSQLMVPALTANNGGRYYGITAWSPASLSLSNATVTFAETNTLLWVTNDVTLDGATAILTLNGSSLYSGGGLLLTNSARMIFNGARTNGPAPHYALTVNGAGTIAIATNCSITVTGITTNDASVYLKASDLILASNASIVATGAGFGGGSVTNGWGPGGGLIWEGGGGYGGKGGHATKGGPVYGSETAPDLPGSGGGGNGTGGRGGGYVRAEVANTVTLAGTINVNGGTSPGTGGGGSGGAIYISADTFTPAAGILTANGGSGANNGFGGGGGRIALAYRINNYSGATNVLAGGTTSYTGFPGTVSMQLVGSLVALSVQGSPVVHGTSTPFGYGASGVPSGSVVTNTVDSPTDITSTQRFLCLGWTATTNGSLSASGGTTQAVFTILTDTVQTWLWTNQFYLTASMGPSGSLETAVTGWYTNGDAVTLTAVPEAGYRFSQWTGDLPAGVYTNNPLTVTMNQARTLAGYCVPQAPGTITWNGTGDWFSATNWTPVGVPGIQDAVRIDSGLVTLSRDPTTVASLDIGGRLMVQSNSILTVGQDIAVTGATARLIISNAWLIGQGSLALTNGGALYVYGGQTNGSPVTNYGALVSLAQDLSIGSNSWIYPYSHPTNGGSCLFQVSNLTVLAGGGINAAGKGYSGGNGAKPGADVHAGWGPGCGGNTSGGGYGGAGGNNGGAPYGSVTAPNQPGSGGGDYYYNGGHGGGLVWVQAANAVTVDGLISAQGGNGVNGGPGAAGSGGSGGGIFITCRTVSGSNGLFNANGGNTPQSGAAYGGGGGGRIALVYDTVAQSALPKASLNFCSSFGTGASGNGQPGTIYLSDSQLLSSSLTTNSSGRYYGLTSWSVDSLTVSNATVVFAEAGVDLRVTNDLTVYGAAGSLTFSTSRLRVGGSLMLTNSAQLTFAGALPDGLPPHYALDVDGTGTVVIASNSSITVTGATTNDASVRFRGSDFVLAAGATVTDRAGFGGGVGTNGWGPGGGLMTTGGGGYGGRGGDAVKGGGTYGSEAAPDLPGSGGGASGTGGRGGGYVRVEVANTVTLAGTIDVNGGNASATGGGGSGGGIYVSADTLAPAAGLLTANGGNGSAAGYYGGGGGRIALAYRINNYAGATNVNAGGTGSYTGLPGTVSLQLSGALLELFVQGSLGSHGTSTPYNYGSSGLPEGTVVTNTVDSPTDITATQRFVCLGWTAQTNGSVLTTGATTEAIFTMVTNTVQTWIWTNQYYLTASTGPSGSLQTAVTGWYTNGNVVTLTAEPLAGYQFSQWVGDLPSGTYTSNPLAVTMNQARTITGYFTPQAPIAIAWNGTGDWFSVTNWTPVGVPGAQDAVRINSGVVKLSKDPTTVGALDVGGTFIVQSNSLLTVMQDITVTGATARLVITNALLAGQRNLTLSGGGSLYTYATGTNPAALVSTTCQVRVDLAGNLAIGSNSWVYPYSHFTNGGVARFTMHDLIITAPNSGFDASGKGFRGGLGSIVTGAGPGAGHNTGGGGYGGTGGSYSFPWGRTYGDSNFPAMPGSGGGQWSYNGGFGGGCIWIEARGKVDVGGALNANGGNGPFDASGGSGGSIYVRCRRLKGGGLLLADGGSSGSNGGGGGGRIALYHSRDDFTGTITYTNGTAAVGKTGQVGTLVRVLTPETGSTYIMR